MVKLATVFLFLGTTSCSYHQTTSQQPKSGPVEAPGSTGGVWQDQGDPEFFLEVEGTQILIATGGRVREAATILQPASDGLLVCEDGHELRLRVRRVGAALSLFHPKEGKERRLARIDYKPAALSLVLQMAEPLPLPAERVLSIQREVRLRREAEHALFRQNRPRQEAPFPWLQSSSPSAPPGFLSNAGEIDLRVIDRYGDNGEYMRNLVQEVGWLDVRRFGYPSSHEAFFLVQHSWDLPLMLAVLPRIKEDAVAGLIDGGAYALMFDRAQLTLGRAQRFGSQVARGPAGEVVVLPLEDPQEVDARRQQWGLQPLKDYVRLIGASEVRLSTECSALAHSPTPPP